MNKPVIAHMREKDRETQSLTNHLCETSDLARQFADKIGLKEIGEITGLLHDLGKACEEFQNYLGSATGLIDPDQDEYIDVSSKKGEIDHSSAGAQLIYKHFYNKGFEGIITAQILALCIASHHSGLIDCIAPDGEDKFTKRINKSDEKTHLQEAVSNLDDTVTQKIDKVISNDIERKIVEKLESLIEPNDSKETLAFKYGLLIRFLLSCLLDADRLSTADFEDPYKTSKRNYGKYQPWKKLIQRLDKKINEFEHKKLKNEVDKIRSQVSQDCLQFSTKPKGIYQLTVPTGGGKTLASLRFALNHAAHYKMDRIFYIVPYTSIIDQNADQIRNILEDKGPNGQFLDKVVLEHHSNLTPEKESYRQNLLSENWDAPIVFTTQVQFLESLFSAGTRGARRMHQLANSVIIFDEIQTLPIRCVHMFNVAIRFLVHDCGSTVVLCTATQPLLDKIEPAHRAISIKTDQKIISNEDDLYDKLRRVNVLDRRKVGGWNENEISELVKQVWW
ncbi:MAG: CRISPR-associated endonuclease Cas3'' [Anaerolineaceae bacterium]|nr:CRISPR-associated endonuclease Cas3'' [Anaerolineaceae bacterium]